MLATTIFNHAYLHTFRIFLANEINEASTTILKEIWQMDYKKWKIVQILAFVFLWHLIFCFSYNVSKQRQSELQEKLDKKKYPPL